MRVEEMIKYGNSFVNPNIVKILVTELLNIKSLELSTHLEDKISTETVDKYISSIKELKNGKPIQYVLGNVNFYGEIFEINPNVLIPRFETEELVERTVAYIKKYFTKPIDIIDLGCGSGVIGLMLEKKVPTNSVDLVDISDKALEVAHKNCVKHNSKSNLIHSDMFTNITKKYDVIISNPPYIKDDEIIEKIVKDNEPHLALFAGKDGLDCYKKILINAKEHMKERCLIAFEIGMTQANDIKMLAEKYLENIRIEVIKDLSDKDRMLFIFKNLE